LTKPKIFANFKLSPGADFSKCHPGTMMGVLAGNIDQPKNDSIYVLSLMLRQTPGAR